MTWRQQAPFLLIFHWVLYYFVEIDVFDVDSRPKAILDPKTSKNDPNLGAKREPKAIKNRCRKLIEVLIDWGVDQEGDTKCVRWGAGGGRSGPAEIFTDGKVDENQIFR